MGKYINEEAKKCLKWILLIWDEKRQINAEQPVNQQLSDEQLLPSFSEYDKDPRTPRANSLAQYFGSYSEGVKEAKRYDKRREELEPAKVVPPSVTKPRTPDKKAKRRTTATPATITHVTPTPPKPVPTTPPTPQKAPEAPSTPKVEPIAAPEPKMQPATSQKDKAFGPLKENGGHFRIPHKRPAEQNDRIALTQSLGDIIPPELFDKFDDLPEGPAPEPIVHEPPTHEPAAPEPVDAPTETKPRLVNYYAGKLAFISEVFYKSYFDGVFKLGTNYPTLPREDGIYAEAPAEDYDEIEVESIDGKPISVPITSDKLVSPYLVKDGHVRAFPDPEPGQLLLVKRQVAEAAKKCGRSTDDLVFPKTYIMTINGIILCLELGKL